MSRRWKGETLKMSLRGVVENLEETPSSQDRAFWRATPGAAETRSEPMARDAYARLRADLNALVLINADAIAMRWSNLRSKALGFKDEWVSIQGPKEMPKSFAWGEGLRGGKGGKGSLNSSLGWGVEGGAVKKGNDIDKS